MKVRTEPTGISFQPFDLIITIESPQEHQALRALANINVSVSQTIADWLYKQTSLDIFKTRILAPFNGNSYALQQELSSMLGTIAGHLER